MAAPALDFSHERLVGRFELIREIARGGMGQVFLARDTKLGRKVAIKFLLKHDPEFGQRFLVEARATARCTHENIVTIFEVGEHDGLPFMVLEYLEGKPLSGVLEGKPGVRAFVELMVPVARALERAHEHGIVHRDLKPSNIFVTDRGQVKVLDFGVARLIDKHETAQMAAVTLDPIDATSTFTGSNSLVGTLPYMSPEQWGAGEVDALSDIWAFGIMFWRALTGVHPAGTMAADKLQARLCDLDTPLPSIGSRDPTLPRALVAIVDRCLEKRKAQRYQSASDVLGDLMAFLQPRADRTTGETCPYRGLAAFGEEDAKFFFGRTSDIRCALAQLEAWPLLAVVGPSGVGKSSFVHAGLIPAVRASGGAWDVRVLRPGRVPIHRLAGVLDDGEDLVGKLVESPGLFGDRLRQEAMRKDTRVLVVVDQLEELFTLCDSDELRRLFLAALLGSADDPSSPVRVVLSMRADFLDRLAGHKQFLAELSRGLYFLSAPDHENLRETLERPAELAGYAFEHPSIVEDMMQAATSKGALPLLSFAATRLWDARDRQARLFTVAAYQQMGGVGGAFARHADQVAAALPPQSQPLLRAILTRLVTPEGTRAVVDRGELLGLGDGADAVIDHLVRARLIQVHTDAQGTTVEIVHEMLITEWPMLARWLQDSQAMRGFTHELRQAAKQWAARGRSRDLVWRGATAQEALANASRHALDLSVIEREFLAAVRSEASRARRRQVAVFATIFSVLGLVIAGGAIAFVRVRAAEIQAKDTADAAAHALKQAQASLAAEQAAQRQKTEAEKQAELARQKSEEAQQLASEATHAESMTKEELAKKNAELNAALSAAREQQKRAEAAAELAKKASDEAKAAKTQAEALAAKEHAELLKAQARMKDIDSGDLRK
ncbi:MAG: protein kinase [Deltaproteobacteria bacterium]|nr:protein kinase [Deltaproteobacteria bacterium]